MDISVVDQEIVQEKRSVYNVLTWLWFQLKSSCEEPQAIHQYSKGTFYNLSCSEFILLFLINCLFLKLRAEFMIVPPSCFRVCRTFRKWRYHVFGSPKSAIGKNNIWKCTKFITALNSRRNRELISGAFEEEFELYF